MAKAFDKPRYHLEERSLFDGYITPQNGPEPEKFLLLVIEADETHPFQLSVGKGRSCDVVINEPGISTFHLILEGRQTQVTVRDEPVLGEDAWQDALRDAKRSGKAPPEKMHATTEEHTLYRLRVTPHPKRIDPIYVDGTPLQSHYTIRGGERLQIGKTLLAIHITPYRPIWKKNWFWFVLIALLCLSIGLTTWYLRRPDVRRDRFLDQGISAFQQDDMESARLAFRNAIQLDNQNIQGHHYLGLIAEKQGNARKELIYFLRTLELDPHHVSALEKLARIYFLGGNLKRANAFVDRLLAVSPNNSEGLMVRAGILARMGQEERASQLAKRVLAMDSTQTDALIIISHYHEKQGELVEARRLLEEGLKTRPFGISGALRLRLAGLYRRTGDPEKAEEMLRWLLARKPDVLLYWRALAAFHAYEGNVLEAERVLREAIRLRPNDTRRYLLLADFAARRLGLEQAERILKGFITSHESDPVFRFALGEFYEKTDRLEEARKVYLKIALMAHGMEASDTARRKLAAMSATESNTGEAYQQIQAVLKEMRGRSLGNQDRDLPLLKGISALLRGDAAQAIRELSVALRTRPGMTSAHRLLAWAHYLNGSPKQARIVLTKLVDMSDGAIRDRVALGRLLAQMGKFKEAEAQFLAALEESPNHPALLKSVLQTQLARRLWPEAKETLYKLNNVVKDPAVKQYIWAIYHRARGDVEATISALQQVVKLKPNTIKPLTELVRALVLDNQFGTAKIWLKKVLRKHPDHAPALNLMGEIQLAEGHYQEAISTFEQVTTLRPDWDKSHMNLTSALLAKGDFQSAAKALWHSSTTDPKRVDLVLLLASAYERAEDVDRAITSYEVVLDRDPKNGVAANNLAMLLADHRWDTQDLGRAASLMAPFENTNNPGALDTLGWVRYRQGRLSSAKELLERALKSAPNEPGIQYHLGMVYRDLGNEEKGRALLIKAVSSQETFTGKNEAKRIITGVAQ
ncbi:MAG: tetratricopeptide repeat protein [Magnetococcales bacterium]|nr:tetratricopeptide repeat protein [Magnetococcales bacterium]